ncbi:SAM domain (Sterile alpha motif) domain containing protein [Acanthamoeba castellanii str. Neff]|uniref:SAM domain (Sterile alpha motif) domain containing protein n=1 Tax=Acanthamoeba castellanii (strain ATCC 30010 / Neff) TaxID=1257118 RepID=L8HHF7_ACACF|nr:SAM domain (Sterile alpha motif) domain containing protein [Acanthamoeba castellanii str. Neff]ELR24123.1 SAM domain (Sterile alpha motif) domain containing protein [Acanthamoeba castellanii str. Neff]
MEAEKGGPVEAWARANDVSDLCPVLISNGFTTLASIQRLDLDDMREMGVTRPGDRKRLLIAVESFANAPIPATPQFMITQTPAALHLPAPEPHLAPPTLPSPTKPDIRIPPTRNPKRCKTKCHQYHIPGERHQCGPEDVCKGFEVCGHLDLHPDEKKRRRAEKKSERKRRKTLEQEEEGEWKKKKDELLRVKRLPQFDGWWQAQLEEVVRCDPDQYSLEEGTRKRAQAMAAVARKYTEFRRVLRREAAINTQIETELRASGMKLSLDAEVEYIARRQKELASALEEKEVPADEQGGDEELP